MALNIGLKIGSTNTQYTKDILSFYDQNIFQYIELFVPTNTYNETIDYWKQFDIPFGIHAPHSAAGLNVSDVTARNDNKLKIEEALRFTDMLHAHYLIFHSGVDGTIEEVITQLKPYADERFLIENKPVKGLRGEHCIGTDYKELTSLISSIGKGCGFVLDFGHAICAANSLHEDPISFIKTLTLLNPRVYHLTDGDFNSEFDSHLHYGEGSFPLKQLLKMVPATSPITNEAKRKNQNNLHEFKADLEFLLKLV